MAYQNMSLFDDKDKVQLEDFIDNTDGPRAESVLRYKTKFKDGQTGDEYSLFENRLFDENGNILALDSPSRDMSFIANKYKNLGIIEEKNLDLYGRIPWHQSGTWVWPFGKVRTVYVHNNKIFCETASKDYPASMELVKIKIKTHPNSYFEFKAFVGPQDIDKKYVRHLLAKRYEFAGDSVTQLWLENMDKYWSKIEIKVSDLYVLTPFNHTKVEYKDEIEDWS